MSSSDEEEGVGAAIVEVGSAVKDTVEDAVDVVESATKFGLDALPVPLLLLLEAPTLVRPFLFPNECALYSLVLADLRCDRRLGSGWNTDAHPVDGPVCG